VIQNFKAELSGIGRCDHGLRRLVRNAINLKRMNTV